MPSDKPGSVRYGSGPVSLLRTGATPQPRREKGVHGRCSETSRGSLAPTGDRDRLVGAPGGGGPVAVVQSLSHERSARCVRCEQPVSGRRSQLERSDDWNPRYLCQRRIDAGVGPETAQRCRDHHALILPFPFWCRDSTGCTSSHNPDGPRWLFEGGDTDRDGARVRSFAVHFGAERRPWDDTVAGVEHLGDLGRFDGMVDAINWLRAYRPTWRPRY